MDATRDVVVVGASAGGVHALRELVSLLPSNLSASVLVVVHIGSHDGSLASILSRSGPNPASVALDADPLEHGRIYVAAPDHHLLIDEEGAMRVERGAKEHHTRPAIDPLFRSAALHWGPRVIGVLLSGRLDDGTAGLHAIKRCGGLALVQDPDEAEEPGMPRSALRHVQVDHVLPVRALAVKLAELVQQRAPAAAPAPPALLREAAVANGLPAGRPAIEHLEAFTEPSTFVCPECGGALWRMTEGPQLRYRCHTGHGYSLRTLERMQLEQTNEALWSAIRALQERQAALTSLAEVAKEEGDATARQEALAEIERLDGQTATLRTLIGSATKP